MKGYEGITESQPPSTRRAVLLRDVTSCPLTSGHLKTANANLNVFFPPFFLFLFFYPSFCKTLQLGRLFFFFSSRPYLLCEHCIVARSSLRSLPDILVYCSVFTPPFYNLRITADIHHEGYGAPMVTHGQSLAPMAKLTASLCRTYSCRWLWHSPSPSRTFYAIRSSALHPTMALMRNGGDGGGGTTTNAASPTQRLTIVRRHLDPDASQASCRVLQQAHDCAPDRGPRCRRCH